MLALLPLSINNLRKFAENYLEAKQATIGGSSGRTAKGINTLKVINIL